MKKSELNDLDEVKQKLLNPTRIPSNFSLSLSQFKILYKDIIQVKGQTTIDIVNNSDWAIVQFSQLSNDRIRIFPDNIFSNFKKFFSIHLFLEEKDFEITETNANYFGQKEYITFWRFLLEEIQVNGIRFLISFLIFGLFLTFINDRESLIAANELVVGVAAIFFSIFLLFTVSQNLPLSNLNNFKNGLTHRFVQIDSRITYLVIFIIGIALINLIISSNNSLILSCIKFVNWSTSLSISLMAISLIIVVQYYYRRAKSLFEVEMSKKILDEAFEKKKNK